MARRTLVFVHAHPDDEALLTAGTMARASHEGHRVVLVVATDGAAGLASTDFSTDLAIARAQELEESAAILGVDELISLGYSDSGLHAEVSGGFASIRTDEVAGRLADICREVHADVIVGYDPSGGYGHPDHLQVHRCVRQAWHQASPDVRLFEATLPREPIARAVRLAAASRLTPRDFDPAAFAAAWTPRHAITHRVDVRAYLGAKIGALRAHASQATADGSLRTLAVLTRLPRLLSIPLLGTEYYCEVPRQPAAIADTAPTSS